jgi:hypothetical protein
MPALLVVPVLWAQGGTESVKSLWRVRSAHALQGALKPEMGFSFTYDGKKAGPALTPDWQVSSQSPDETTFRHASGLVVTRTSRAFPEFEAFEYTLRFKNSTPSALPALSAVNALDLTFGGDIVKGISALTSGGGAADAVYPPKDFALARTYFGPIGCGN